MRELHSGPLRGNSFAQSATELQSVCDAIYLGCDVRILELSSAELIVPRFAHAAYGPELQEFALEFERTVGEFHSPFSAANAIREKTTHGLSDVVNSIDQPLELLKALAESKPLTCHPFATVLAQACIANGYTARVLSLSMKGQSFDHAVCEVYIPEHGKWVVIDPDFNVAYRRRSQLLDAWELHELWSTVRRDAAAGANISDIHRQKSAVRNALETTGLEPVILGQAGEDLRKKNMHDAEVSGINLSFYEYVLYPVRNDQMTAWYPPAHPVRIDQWLLVDNQSISHKLAPEARRVLAKRDVYFHPGAVGVEPRPRESTDSNCILNFRLHTWTPNFKYFRIALDEELLISQDGLFSWQLKSGTNTAAIESVNSFDLAGPAARLVLEVE